MMKVVLSVAVFVTCLLLVQAKRQSPLGSLTMTPQDLVTPSFGPDPSFAPSSGSLVFTSPAASTPKYLTNVVSSIDEATNTPYSSKPEIIERKSVEAQAVEGLHLPPRVITTSASPCGCINQPSCACAPVLVPTPCGCLPSVPSCTCNRPLVTIATGSGSGSNSSGSFSAETAADMRRILMLQKQLRRVVKRALSVMANSTTPKVAELVKKMQDVIGAEKQVEKKGRKNEKAYRNSSGAQGADAVERDVKADLNLQKAFTKLFNKTQAELNSTTGLKPQVVDAVKTISIAVKVLTFVADKQKQILAERSKSATADPKKLNDRLEAFSAAHGLVRSQQLHDLQKLFIHKDEDLKSAAIDLKQLLEDGAKAENKARVDLATIKVAEKRLEKEQKAHLTTQKAEQKEVAKLIKLVNASSKAAPDVKKTVKGMKDVVKAQIHETKEKLNAVQRQEGKKPSVTAKQTSGEKIKSDAVVKKVLDKTVLDLLTELRGLVSSEKVKGEIGSVMKVFQKAKDLQKKTSQAEKKNEKGDSSSTKQVKLDVKADQGLAKEEQEAIKRLESIVNSSAEGAKRIDDLMASIKKAVGIVQTTTNEQVRAVEKADGKAKNPAGATRTEKVEAAMHVDAVLQKSLLLNLDKVAESTLGDQKVAKQIAQVKKVVTEDVKIHGQEKAAEQHAKVGSRLLETARAKDKGAAKAVKKALKKIQKVLKKKNIKIMMIDKALKNIRQAAGALMLLDHLEHNIMQIKEGKVNTRQLLSRLTSKRGSGSSRGSAGSVVITNVPVYTTNTRSCVAFTSC